MRRIKKKKESESREKKRNDIVNVLQYTKNISYVHYVTRQQLEHTIFTIAHINQKERKKKYANKRFLFVLSRVSLRKTITYEFSAQTMKMIAKKEEDEELRGRTRAKIICCRESFFVCG